MIGIVNYGCGNIGSILNMCKYIGVDAKVIGSGSEMGQCDRFILPGVGHFDYGMSELKSSGLLELLEYQVLELKKPILGICLGAQMLTKGSEEGTIEGLGWINANTKEFSITRKKVPHMGWNNIELNYLHPVFEGLEEENRFYFVHKYYMEANEAPLGLAQSYYEIAFHAVIASNNIVGVQFHPEKSHKFGMKLLKNFNAWNL